MNFLRKHWPWLVAALVLAVVAFCIWRRARVAAANSQQKPKLQNWLSGGISRLQEIAKSAPATGG